MKALSLTQPWASLVASGAKQVETRSWTTGYRGALAIHAAKGFPLAARSLCAKEPFAAALRRAGYGGLALVAPEQALPRGVIVAVCRLADVRPTSDPTQAVIDHVGEELLADEAAFGDYSWGRYAWFLEDVVPLRVPVEARGSLGLWEVPPDAELVIRGVETAQAFARDLKL